MEFRYTVQVFGQITENFIFIYLLKYYIILYKLVCSTNMSKHCKNKQHFTCSLNMDGLFHKITECCIKYGVIQKTEKLCQSSK